MSFSGMVKIKLDDIDDYIGPGNECTKPVKIEKAKGKVRVSRDSDGTYKNNKGMTLEKAKITLEDCLACSGCVTSAETVLITQQSVEEFKNALSIGKKVVVTLSQQSNLSLAQRFSLSPLDSMRLIRGALADFGVIKTRDLTPFRDMCLLETLSEFMTHHEEMKAEQTAKRTLLCSSCPGFVCYAEKTHGDLLVPKLSKVRSPQQISGLLLKLEDPEFYHVSVMPCFDKKLEAARTEFESVHDGTKVRDVDCVLATVEIEKLIEEKLKENQMEHFIEIGTVEDEVLYSHGGGGSGGYLENIFRHVAKLTYGKEINEPLKYEPIRRNKDFLETTLKDDQGQVILRFAKAYGFRSIQNLVSRMKQRKGVQFDYIEVMACPSGCLNGGGQIRFEDREENKLILEKLIEQYDEAEVREPSSTSKLSAADLYTTFRIIPKIEDGIPTNW